MDNLEGQQPLNLVDEKVKEPDSSRILEVEVKKETRGRKPGVKNDPALKTVIKSSFAPESPTTRNRRKVEIEKSIKTEIEPMLIKFGGMMFAGLTYEEIYNADGSLTDIGSALVIPEATTKNLTEAWVRFQETSVGANIAAKTGPAMPFIYLLMAAFGVAQYGTQLAAIRKLKIQALQMQMQQAAQNQANNAEAAFAQQQAAVQQAAQAAAQAQAEAQANQDAFGTNGTKPLPAQPAPNNLPDIEAF